MATGDEDQLDQFGSLHIEDDVDSTEETCLVSSVFDQVIGHIELIIMDAQFQQIQNEFMEKHWMEFDDSEENKLVYMDIFQEYTDTIEKYIEDQLQTVLPEFEMADFVQQVKDHKDELDGEIFEILFTFTDFLIFKDMFLDYKAVKEGRVVDLSSNIIVTSLHDFN